MPTSPGHPSLPDPEGITRLLRAAETGESEAVDTLFRTVYDELRRLARVQRQRVQGQDTLNTTALVNEAYLKLMKGAGASLSDRAHFYAVAATAMRQILLNYAERRATGRRGGGRNALSLEEAVAVPADTGGTNPVSPDAAVELLALDAALGRLAAFDRRQSRVVEFRFFAGLSVADTAEVMGISPATVKRDWTLASAWLRREMTRTLASGDPADLEPVP